MTTPIKWFGPLIGPGIAFNAMSPSKYLYLYIFLWGMWGDSVLSLIQRGFAAPHMLLFVGEIPHKKGGGEKAANQINKTVPHKKCGELPTEAKAASLARRGLEDYLPNSPHFTDTYTYVFYSYQKPVRGSFQALPGEGNSDPVFYVGSRFIYY
ncbi:MAG: hypothetical protein ACXWAT_07790 [Methylobacter sp.]